MSLKNQRTCVLCRKKTSKDCLMRFFVINNVLELSTGGNKLNKGYYLCKNSECVISAKKKKVLSKILKKKINNDIFDDVLKSLIK